MQQRESIVEQGHTTRVLIDGIYHVINTSPLLHDWLIDWIHCVWFADHAELAAQIRGQSAHRPRRDGRAADPQLRFPGDAVHRRHRIPKSRGNAQTSNPNPSIGRAIFGSLDWSQVDSANSMRLNRGISPDWRDAAPTAGGHTNSHLINRFVINPA